MPKRKTRSSTANDETQETKNSKRKTDDDVANTIIGGLKDPTLNSRITRNEDNGIEHFKVPFNDKFIICERRGDSSSKKTLIFTHGAGGGIANPATADFASGFGNVVCFQGTMNLTNRVKTFNAVIEHELEGQNAGGSLVLGGRSMGARAAVLTALERKDVEALVLVSYPLLTGKKEREYDRREKILLDLPEECDVLFVIGSEDAQCDFEVLEEIRGKLNATSWLIMVEGADHGMSLKRKDKAGVEAIRKNMGTASAKWLQERDSAKRESSIRWDDEKEEVVCEDWKSAWEQEPDKKKSKTGL